MDEQKVSPERIEQLMEIMKRGNFITAFGRPEEDDALIAAIIKSGDAELAAYALRSFDAGASKERWLTPENKEQLKQVVLKTNDDVIACEVLLNHPQIFTKNELSIIRKLAYTTQNEYLAYHIYRNDCIALMREPAARASLRRIVMNTKNPERALEFLGAQEEMREPYDDYAQSLEYTDAEINHFKQVIISNDNPWWAFRLLYTNETQPENDEDEFDEWSEKQVAIPLTPNDRKALTRAIMESQSANSFEAAYRTFCDIGGLSEGERMVLKGKAVRTKEPGVACDMLCNTDFIAHLNKEERDYLRKLAAQVKDQYSARNALKYIFDLTQDERATLEAVSMNI